MAAWIIPQVSTCDPQHQAHLFPHHTLAAALTSGEVTNCNLQAAQLVLGTPTQQAAAPADTGGGLCLGCALRPPGMT